MVAKGHVFCLVLWIYLIFSSINCVFSSKKCKDARCSAPISIARAIEDHTPKDSRYLNFKKGDDIAVYSKVFENGISLWEGKVKGSPSGYFLSSLVKETQRFVQDEQLVDSYPIMQGKQDNQGESTINEPVESVHVSIQEEGPSERDYQRDINGGHTGTERVDTREKERKKEEEEEARNKEQEILDTSEKHGRDASNESGENPKHVDGHIKGGLENGGSLKVQEHDPNTKDSPVKVLNGHSRDRSDTQLGDGVKNDEASEQDRVDIQDEDNKDTVAGQQSNNGSHSLASDREVSTNNDDEEESSSTDHESNDSGDDTQKAANPKKPAEENSNQETPDGGEMGSKKLKKEGFFSSMKNLVSDFTENIMKDFQGDEDKAAGKSPDPKEGEQQEPDKLDKKDIPESTDEMDEKADDKSSDGKTHDASGESPDKDTEPTIDGDEVKKQSYSETSAEETFKQRKAEQLQRVKGLKEALKTPEVVSNGEGDLDEKMKEQAKRTIERIPSLVKESGRSEDEQEQRKVEGADNELKTREVTPEKLEDPALVGSDDKADERESASSNVKMYSDKVLCNSVKDREVCDDSDDREKCRRENCCFDDHAEKGKKCFLKPSQPEPGYIEEEEDSSSDEEEQEVKEETPEENKDSAVTTTNQGEEVDAEDVDSSQSEDEKSDSSEKTDPEQTDSTSQLSSQNKDRPSSDMDGLTSGESAKNDTIDDVDVDDGKNLDSAEKSDQVESPELDTSSNVTSDSDTNADGGVRTTTDEVVLDGDGSEDNSLPDIVDKQDNSEPVLQNPSGQTPDFGSSVDEKATQKFSYSSTAKDSVGNETDSGKEKSVPVREEENSELRTGDVDVVEEKTSSERGADEDKDEPVEQKIREDSLEDTRAKDGLGISREESGDGRVDDMKERVSPEVEDPVLKSESTDQDGSQERPVKDVPQNKTPAGEEVSGNSIEKIRDDTAEVSGEKDEMSVDKQLLQSSVGKTVESSVTKDIDDKAQRLSETPILRTRAENESVSEESKERSGSTLFQTDTHEDAVKVGSTVDKKRGGIERTADTGGKPEIVPTQTLPNTNEATGTIITGTPPTLERKHQEIASKWMRNKLMKGQAPLLTEKYGKGLAGFKAGNQAESEGVIKPSTGTNESSTAVPVSTTTPTPTPVLTHTHKDVTGGSKPEDQDSDTCTKKEGGCQKTSFFSSLPQGSIFGKDGHTESDPVKSDDVKNMDGNIKEEETEEKGQKVEKENEVKNEAKVDEVHEEQNGKRDFKDQFVASLRDAVRSFRVYHTMAAEYGMVLLKPINNVLKSLGKQMGLEEVIGQLESELKQGPQGVIALILIMMSFMVYLMLGFLCGKKLPPSYGPNLKDFFKTFEGRIRILEEECVTYQEEIKKVKNRASENVGRSSALEKELEDEKHEKSKSEEQISILKEIVKNLNEKVDLLEEESSKLKQSLEEKNNRCTHFEQQLVDRDKQIESAKIELEESKRLLDYKEQEKNNLLNNINDYRQQLCKAEDDTHRHKGMLQDWNDRYMELQQKYDDMSVSKQSLEEQLHFKDNEIEVLCDSLVQINKDVRINSDEELSEEELKEERSRMFRELMDVAQIKTDYKSCREQKEKLQDDIKQEVDRREKLEGEVEQLEIDLAKSKASEEEIRFKYKEADIKLNALQDYFKNMESDLHRKLTAEETARLASESELERKLREASTAVQDVELYRKQVEELRKEIDETQQAFRSQVASAEERAHENWLKFRSAERQSEEIKRERDALRRRLYDLETNMKPSASPEVPAENVESPVVRSESPASVRSSKRKISNPPAKSPTGILPPDERKERLRRKTRDRKSPPVWEPPDMTGGPRRRGKDKDTVPPPPPWDPDMGASPRRRDRERETPPPPPSWEAGVGPPSRRRGQRESPVQPTSVLDLENQRRRRDRYSPSPPPPPPDMNQGPPRRRRRDKGTTSSPPPPPNIMPPPNILSPRGPPPGAPPPPGAISAQAVRPIKTSVPLSGVYGSTYLRDGPNSALPGMQTAPPSGMTTVPSQYSSPAGMQTAPPSGAMIAAPPFASLTSNGPHV